jgi:hypothetical protein
MSYRRPIPTPLKGIDARTGLNVNLETVSYAVSVRASEEDLRSLSYYRNYTPSPSGGTNRGRNILQFFVSIPGGADFNGLIILTNNSAYRVNPDLSVVTLQTGYNLNGYVTGLTTIYPRFGVVNTANKVAWTCALASPPVKVRVYDSTTVTAITQDYAAHHMIAFANRLVIANTIEAGVRNSARIRWCVNRNFTDWTGLGSGFLDVGSHQSSGRVLALNNFGAIAVVALEHELIELQSTGSLFPVFQLGTHHRGVTVIAAQSWQVWNNVAFFLGPDSVYAWNQGSGFTDVGKPISAMLAPYLVPEKARWAQATILPARGEYRLLMTSGANDGDAIAKVFVYDIKADRWFLDEPLHMTSISTLVLIQQTDGYMNQQFFAPSMEYTIGTGVTDAGLFEQSTDVNMPERPEIITQDYLALNVRNEPDVNERNEFLNLYFYTVPNSQMFVGYSVNKGASFTMTQLTANADGLINLSAQVSFSTIRFRFLYTTPQGTFRVGGPMWMEWDKAGTVY